MARAPSTYCGVAAGQSGASALIIRIRTYVLYKSQAPTPLNPPVGADPVSAHRPQGDIREGSSQRTHLYGANVSVRDDLRRLHTPGSAHMRRNVVPRSPPRAQPPVILSAAKDPTRSDPAGNPFRHHRKPPYRTTRGHLLPWACPNRTPPLSMIMITFPRTNAPPGAPFLLTSRRCTSHPRSGKERTYGEPTTGTRARPKAPVPGKGMARRALRLGCADPHRAPRPARPLRHRPAQLR